MLLSVLLLVQQWGCDLLHLLLFLLSPFRLQLAHLHSGHFCGYPAPKFVACTVALQQTEDASQTQQEIVPNAFMISDLVSNLLSPIRITVPSFPSDVSLLLQAFLICMHCLSRSLFPSSLLDPFCLFLGYISVPVSVCLSLSVILVWPFPLSFSLSISLCLSLSVSLSLSPP